MSTEDNVMGQKELAEELAKRIIRSLEGEVTLAKIEFDLDVRVYGRPYQVKVIVSEQEKQKARQW